NSGPASRTFSSLPPIQFPSGAALIAATIFSAKSGLFSSNSFVNASALIFGDFSIIHPRENSVTGMPTIVPHFAKSSQNAPGKIGTPPLEPPSDRPCLGSNAAFPKSDSVSLVAVPLDLHRADFRRFGFGKRDRQNAILKFGVHFVLIHGAGQPQRLRK